MAKLILVLVICLSVFTTWVFAQEAAPTSIDDVEQAALETPEAPKQVDVQPVAQDDDISDRLTDILVATEWFTDPDVSVKDGVVFLRGTALEEKYRTWATDLAQNTEAVAAVVNRLKIQPRSIWDMSPALRELRLLATNAVQMSPLILFGLIVIALTWFFAKLTERFASWFFQIRIGNPLLRNVVAQAAMLPILLLGIYIVLRVSGLTQLALTVLGGTGIAGLIIGIAFRDIAENFLASILISAQNPFRAGDLIDVDGHLGLVQRVTTRGTLLMTFDGNHVQVPNSTVYKSTITNYSANPNRRMEFIIGIGYDDSVTKAQEVIKGVLDKHPNIVADPESRVIVHELGASTVNLKVYIWLDASKNAPDGVRSSVMRMVKQALLREGISMPDEAREVIFPNQVPVRMIRDDSDASNGKEKNRSAIVGSNESSSRIEKETECDEEVHSAGEGNLDSDTDEIQRQADQSRMPEEGVNLLETETKK